MAWDNGSLYGNLSSNASQYSIPNATSDVAEAVGASLAGQTELIGIIILLFVGYALWKSDVGMDVSIAVLIPGLVYVADFGFVPGGQSVTAGVILAVAVMVALAVKRIIS